MMKVDTEPAGFNLVSTRFSAGFIVFFFLPLLADDYPRGFKVHRIKRKISDIHKMYIKDLIYAIARSLVECPIYTHIYIIAKQYS